MAPRTVLIVVFDGVQSLDVTGPLEVFTGANDHLAARGRARPTRSPSPGPAGAGPHLQRADPGPRHRPADRAGAAHAGGAGRRGISGGQPGADRLAAAARAGGPADHLGLHRRVPAGPRRPAGRQARDHALGLRRCPGAAVSRGAPSTRSRSTSGTAPSSPRPGSPRASTWPWPWSRRTSAGRPRWTWPGTWSCSCAARAARPSSARSCGPSWPGAGRCARSSSGSASARPPTCRCPAWPPGPTCPPGSSPAASPPRPA